MKFSDSRVTLVKVPNQKVVYHETTPRYISPWENGLVGGKPKPGIKTVDIFRPVYNRASRRANGQVRSRKRLVVEPHWLQNLLHFRKLQEMQK